MADTPKAKFGIKQLSNTTPEWAKWIFRGWFIVSKVLVGFIAGLAALKELNIPPLALTLTLLIINLLIDPLMFGFSKLWGIPLDDTDTATTSNDTLHLEPIAEQ